MRRRLMLSQVEKRIGLAGWRGVSLVAITYIYFLIFAQFGFLERLGDLGINGPRFKMAVGLMAVGGIAASLFASRLEGFWLPARRLQAGLLGCAVGALSSLLRMNYPAGLAISLLVGLALGLLTVTLVGYLKMWIGV